jgi:hypothetical protein
LALYFKLYRIGTQRRKSCADRDPVSQSSFTTLLAGTGDSKKSESQLEERKSHVKNLNNLFGDQEGRGHGVAREPKPDSKWVRGVKGRTVPIEDAILWIFNEWIDRNKLAERPINNWEQQRKIWASEGADEGLRIKSEAEMVAKMVSSLPVFVLKNLGMYYSGNMLMYATGTNAHPTDPIYRWLRDHRLKGRTDREAGEARQGSKPEPARAANVAAPGPGGLAVVQVPGGGSYVDRGLLGPLGFSGGASEGSSSGRSELVSSLSEQFGLSFSLVGLSSSSVVANLVIGAAVKNNLSIYKSMERAVAQYEAVGGDHLALRRTFIKMVGESAARPPQTEPEEESADLERTETCDGLT